MRFITAAHTDVGIKKKTNQDSLLIHQAETDFGTVLLAVMCDGMGGLAKGEVASACMINAFSDWFKNTLPGILYEGFEPEVLRESWEDLVSEVNFRISDYAGKIHTAMGTTCVAFLTVGDTYYIMNIGDSRAYLISDNVFQLTKDQTLVQREMDLGRITYEESLVHPQRSVLLQCIGAGSPVIPDFFMGNLAPKQVYLLCCDGFRHVVGPEEFFAYLGPATDANQDSMKESLVYLTELNKQRNETDNISAVLVRTI